MREYGNIWLEGQKFHGKSPSAFKPVTSSKEFRYIKAVPTHSPQNFVTKKFDSSVILCDILRLLQTEKTVSAFSFFFLFFFAPLAFSFLLSFLSPSPKKVYIQFCIHVRDQ
jgi:hypothetical protein